MAASKRLVQGPLVRTPDSITLVTASVSSVPITGEARRRR
jgi:hypothetical protein